MRILIFTLCALFLCTESLYSKDSDILIPRPKEIYTASSERVQPTRVDKKLLKKCPHDSLREMYSLQITRKSVKMRAYTEQGLRWAERTLEQLRSPEDGSLPQVEIRDWPSFPIRAFMYDSGRNFVEVKQIKEFIDLTSRYKLNAFHWHLTDKPAWRIECKAYPQLNDAQYQRPGRDNGRFYTYDEIRDVIKYAGERGVTIIPEIDMPGHSDFFAATFGFKMESAEGMKVLSACLDEFFREIPRDLTPYMHIGSDEVNISNPKEFMQWALDIVHNSGRIPLVWDPGLPADSTTIRQIWREGTLVENANSDNPASKSPFLDSSMGYLNYLDPICYPNHVFLHDPCHTGYATDKALGGIICLWNDVKVEDKSRLMPHNGMMGGVLAFAERFWEGGKPNEPHRDVLLPPSHPDMQRLMNFQQRMAYHKQYFLQEEMAYWHPNRPTTKWEVSLYDHRDSLLITTTAYGDVVELNPLCDFIKDQKPTFIPDSVALCRARRSIESPCDTVIYARIGFDSPMRSNRISDGIAQQGKWENYGTVTLNGQAVNPPVWKEPGKYHFLHNTWARPEEELPYTDEQLYWTREAVPMHLHKGVNIIELTTRKHFPAQRFQFGLLP